MQDFEIINANLRSALRFFGEATGQGEICSLDGAMAIYAGLSYGVFNISLLDGTHLQSDGGGDRDFERRVAVCAEYFTSRQTRWSFWLCEDFLPAAHLRRAKALLASRGLHRISDAPGMIASGLQAASRPLPEMQCVPIKSQNLRETFAGVVAVTFDIPIAVAQQVYYPERAWRGAYRGFVGLVGGKPVAVVAIVEAAEALGIYSLATLPEERRRGYGEALLRAAVAMEQQRTGIGRLVLQSTQAGYALYKRLGFREISRFSVYLTK